MPVLIFRMNGRLSYAASSDFIRSRSLLIPATFLADFFRTGFRANNWSSSLAGEATRRDGRLSTDGGDASYWRGAARDVGRVATGEQSLLREARVGFRRFAGSRQGLQLAVQHVGR